MNYPMWHIRFVNARNHLANAVQEMEQVVYEDNDNPKFVALHKKMRTLLKAVDTQWMKNCKRIKKEAK